MEVPKETPLNVPEKFSFPFDPYSIQKDFMRNLFKAIDDRKLGIFESPTGTGKSLSLLCGSLSWLEKREDQHVEDLKKLIESFDLEAEEKKAKNAQDWIKEIYQFNQRKEVILKAKRELKFYEDLFQKREKILQRRVELEDKQKKRYPANNKPLEEIQDDGVELKDSFLNDEFAPTQDSDSEDELNEEDAVEEPEFVPTQMIFASRTHSQLSQFNHELKRTEYSKRVTATTLGSRQNMCINPEVSRLGNLGLINERCLDLQKGSKGKKTSEGKKMKKCGGCEFFKQNSIEELKNHILSEPMDIEDLHKVAKNTYKACPYYASRKAAKEAQLVLLPYNTLIHVGTREAVGINLRNSVLLFDEAHNLIESISNMYSTQITEVQVDACSKGLKIYMNRYISRFTSNNLLKLKQLAFILKSLAKYIGATDAKTPKVFSISEFKLEIGIDNLDLYELVKYFQKSKLIFKLKGYLYKCEQDEVEENERVREAAEAKEKKKNAIANRANKKQLPKTEPKKDPGKSSQRSYKAASSQSILNFSEFLRSITTTFNSEGKIFYTEENKTKVFKFMLLGSNKYFKELIEKARSIIILGGTMKPYDEFEEELFNGAKERIYHFSCDHVIPDENLIVLPLSNGPSGIKFDFTFKNRSSPEILKELSNTILNLSRIIPGGIVVFLPSYDYETVIYNSLKSNGILEKIETKKKLFRESKDKNAETVLTEYGKQIRMNKSGGALLFAVVGGKLSEGINFSDELGRCVIVVGLPYPNTKSIEIHQKITHLTNQYGKERGDSYLNTVCSKAVNQSIGRAIRHANDYAAIVLIDHRFSSQTQEGLLPNWIQKRFTKPTSFGNAQGIIAKFFANKRSTSTI